MMEAGIKMLKKGSWCEEGRQPLVGGKGRRQILHDRLLHKFNFVDPLFLGQLVSRTQRQ